jgi:hypothetical protein
MTRPEPFPQTGDHRVPHESAVARRARAISGVMTFRKFGSAVDLIVRAATPARGRIAIKRAGRAKFSMFPRADGPAGPSMLNMKLPVTLKMQPKQLSSLAAPGTRRARRAHWGQALQTASMPQQIRSKRRMPARHADQPLRQPGLALAQLRRRWFPATRSQAQMRPPMRWPTALPSGSAAG